MSPSRGSQSSADGDVCNYNQLTAFSRVRALYDIQHPDLIPHQADHTHMRVLEDTLESRSCGQVQKEDNQNLQMTGTESASVLPLHPVFMLS